MQTNISSELPSMSLVVTCYNLEKYIEESLRSVFNQVYSGLCEVIIIDDASEDNSIPIIEKSIEKYGKNWDITFLRNEKNEGVAGATDKAWRQAKYEWIIEMDGDDIQYPDRCLKTAELIKLSPEAGMIAMSQRCVNKNGIAFCDRYMIKKSHDSVFYTTSPKQRADIFLAREKNYPVQKGAYGCSLAINKKIISLWGPLNDKIIKCFAQDPPWELRAFLTSEIIWSNAIACKYRMHNSNILNKERKLKTLRDFINVELFMCEYDKKEILAINRMLADVSLAINNKNFSDWTQEDLKSLEVELRQFKTGRAIRVHWWNYSFIKKIKLLLKLRNKVPPSIYKSLKSRIIPLHLFAWIKMLKHCHPIGDDKK